MNTLRLGKRVRTIGNTKYYVRIGGPKAKPGVPAVQLVAVTTHARRFPTKTAMPQRFTDFEDAGRFLDHYMTPAAA